MRLKVNNKYPNKEIFFEQIYAISSFFLEKVIAHWQMRYSSMFNLLIIDSTFFSIGSVASTQ